MLYKYINEKGETIEVKEEAWKWEATYKNGEILKQFDDDGIFHRTGEINQDELAVMRLTNGITSIDMPWIDGMRLIHKYRHFRLNIGTENEQHLKIYIFGYEYKKRYHFNYITPNGVIVQSPEDTTLVN